MRPRKFLQNIYRARVVALFLEPDSVIALFDRLWLRRLGPAIGPRDRNQQRDREKHQSVARSWCGHSGLPAASKSKNKIHDRDGAAAVLVRL
jgi:hypothetical protein